MLAWHIPRWALPAALCGVLAIAGADVILMRHHPLAARPQPIPEQIGLHADAEGAGVRVDWDRASRPVRNADHAVLYIEDGASQSHVDLTGRQLDGSSVLYSPESESVIFRLEVYRGTQSSTESAAFALPQGPTRRKQHGPARAIVQQVRPSPFEPVQPVIEVTQVRPPPIIAAPEAVAANQPVAAVEPPRESRLERMIGKIPLLRRWRKHPAADEIESSR
jgi:hypothetical protein